MLDSRRRVLRALAGAAGFAGLLASSLYSQRPFPGDQEPPPAEPPRNRKSAKKALLEEDQKEIRRDVLRLHELATELKEEVEKTDATTFLSLNLVRKAETIEKLAHQIKNRAKGE